MSVLTQDTQAKKRTLEGHITAFKTTPFKGGFATKAVFRTNDATLICLWQHKTNVDIFNLADTYALTGAIKKRGDRLYMIQPEVTLMQPESPAALEHIQSNASPTPTKRKKPGVVSKIAGVVVGLFILAALFGSPSEPAITSTNNKTAKTNSTPLTTNTETVSPTPEPIASPALAPLPTPAPTPVAPTPAPQSSCDPNYSGACVPIASDVDCAGGSGNGPAYVAGPVRVIGSDIYKLDADRNGIGCES